MSAALSLAEALSKMTPQPLLATLEPVRFGEFLRDRNLISDEQWLEALAYHWSSARRKRLGSIIVDLHILPAEIVEAEARVFHDDLEVIEVVPRSERNTVPMPLS
jgi:hypothetical protein